MAPAFGSRGRAKCDARGGGYSLCGVPACPFYSHHRNLIAPYSLTEMSNVSKMNKRGIRGGKYALGSIDYVFDEHSR